MSPPAPTSPHPRAPRQVEVRCGKAVLRLNEPHFLKLHELFCRARRRRVPTDDEGVRSSLFCALQRYESLGGAGMQAALSPRVFDVLRRRFGVSCECFASPFNCRFDAFCSAFPDVDVAFGSLGDFFEVFGGECGGGEPSAAPETLEGSFQANPPFMPELIARMTATINQCLARASSQDRALSFVVVVPAWSEGKACEALARSPHLRRTLMAANRKHEYCEGAQHKKPVGTLRKATCDTAVYFLQSDEGAVRWPARNDACNELLAALSGEEAVASEESLHASPWQRGRRGDRAEEDAEEREEEEEEEVMAEDEPHEDDDGEEGTTTVVHAAVEPRGPERMGRRQRPRSATKAATSAWELMHRFKWCRGARPCTRRRPGAEEADAAEDPVGAVQVQRMKA